MPPFQTYNIRIRYLHRGQHLLIRQYYKDESLFRLYMIRASLKTGLRNIFAFPALIIPGSIPVSFMISRPYLNEKAIPSWAALKRWAFECVLKFRPVILAPDIFIHQHPFGSIPKGSIVRPSDPGATSEARLFISLYDKLLPVFLFSHEFSIPVPLIHSKTPNR